jgi:hypothetical protein
MSETKDLRKLTTASTAGYKITKFAELDLILDEVI